MKNVMLCLLLCGSAYATAQVPYQIKGEWKDAAGKSIYLYQDVKADSVRAIDSVKVAPDFSFVLKGKISDVQRMYVGCNPKEKEDVFIDGTPIEVTVATKTSTNKKTGKASTYNSIKVKGGREQVVLDEGKQLSATMAFFQLGKMLTLSKAVETKDSLVIDSAVYKINVLDSLSNAAVKQYMDTTRNDISSTYFFDRYIFQKCKMDEVETFYNNLTAKVKASYPGKELNKRLVEMRSVNVGGTAPDFTLPTPEGGTYSLSSLKGKIVLLDFWASWCGPCLAELPNVKKVYETYHSKGLEILGVSLDDKHDAWVNMIAKKGMPWHHVSSLKGWQCPIAKRYNVTGIPRMYIIDKDGKIIAQDLRGQALIDKMAEIFGE